MTPLKIEILLWYHYSPKSAGDCPILNNGTEGEIQMKELVEAGIMVKNWDSVSSNLMREDKRRFIPNKEALDLYVKELLKVPLPKNSWYIPITEEKTKELWSAPIMTKSFHSTPEQNSKAYISEEDLRGHIKEDENTALVRLWNKYGSMSIWEKNVNPESHKANRRLKTFKEWHEERLESICAAIMDHMEAGIDVPKNLLNEKEALESKLKNWDKVI